MTRDEFIEQLRDVNVYGVARRFAGNEADAADAMQSALLKVWIHRESVRELGPMLNVTVQRCALTIRRQRARAFVPLDDVQHQIAAPSNHRAEEFSEEVERALHALTPPLRAAFDAVVIEEKDYESAAVALGVPKGTIRSRLNRARAELRSRLEE
jgi:RNA polymerase sigma-70 factor (ECF subfamily)